MSSRGGVPHSAKEKWWPYKIVCLMLYGSQDYIDRPEPGYVHLTLPNMCKELGISDVTLRNYLKYCAEVGMIDDLKLVRGLRS